jgi:C1A family cysteine protease
MKTLICILCCLLYSVALGQDEESIRKDWQNYKRLNELEFSEQEDAQRFAIYKDNFLKVAEHNILYQQNKTSFRAGLSDFSHYNTEETALLKFGLRSSFRFNESDLVKNYNETDLDEFLEEVKLASEARIALPAFVDWRQYSAAIKNQANCGACWAFAAVGVVESLYSIKYNQFKRLSEQQLVDCTLNNRRYLNYGCNGGWPDNAFEFIRQNGVADESYYPYRRYASFCNYRNDLRKIRISRYFPLPRGNEQALKYAVATNGPVAVAIDASNWGFTHYSSGIYSDYRCSSGRLTHAVIVMGYGTERGQDYWLVKNSWGPRWGQVEQKF